jgi:hypothetical protein
MYISFHQDGKIAVQAVEIFKIDQMRLSYGGKSKMETKFGFCDKLARYSPIPPCNSSEMCF